MLVLFVAKYSYNNNYLSSFVSDCHCDCHFSGMMALFPFLTLQARSLGITESELGIIYGFLPITALLGPPLAGMIADKIGNFKVNKHMLFVCGVTTPDI